MGKPSPVAYGDNVKLTFTKAQASGNDFVILDTIRKNEKIAAKELSKLAEEICVRKWSVGADGLLVLEPSQKADFRFRIINPDGSEVAMCGNGSRCAALYAKKEKIASETMKFETGSGIIDAAVRDDTVRVRLTDPKEIKWNFCVTIHDCPYMVNFVNTGVPHVVHLVKDLDAIDVKRLGSDMRYHAEFSPDGTNTDFVKIIDKSTIRVRTYERGVEDETHACGTGVAASALIAAESEKLASPIAVETLGGEVLKVYFEKVEGSFTNIFLEGKAALVFDGSLVM